MTQPIDIAYVELRARGEEDTARDIKKMLDKIQRDVKKLSQQVESSFGEAGRDIERELTEAGSVLTKEAASQRKAWKKVAESIATDIEAGTDSAKRSVDDMADAAVRDLNRIEHAAVRASVAVATAGKGPKGYTGGHRMPDIGRHRGDPTVVDRLSGALGNLAGMASAAIGAVKDLAGEMGNTLTSGAQKATQGIASVVGTLSAALGPIGSLIASLGLVGVALALAPIIIPVIAALSQLSALMLLLPGAIGFLVAAIAPLIMAFNGIGEAVSALASGDLAKIDAAMQKISPQARKFAVEVFGLRDQLKKLKWAVQDAFFEKFNGSLNELVTRLLPSLRSGLAWVSSNLGQLAADLTDTLSSSKAISTLNDLFATTGRIIDDLRGPLMAVVDSLLGGMKASLPFVERMFKSLGRGMQNFADWLNKAVADGRFKKWLEDAFDVAKRLWGLAKSIGKLLGAIFGGTADDGKDFIDMLTEMVDKMTAFFESPEGKRWMQDTIESFKELTAALVALVGAIGAVSRFFARVNQDMIDVGAQADDLWNTISGFFKDLWDDVKGIGASIGQWFKDVGQWFSDLGTTISEKGGEVLQWFQDLPDKISEWLSSLPGKISQFFSDAMDNALYAVGYGIGSIVRFFIDLPGNIAEQLTIMWNTISEWFTSMQQTATDLVRQLYQGVVDWFEKLPGRVSTAVSTIVEKVTEWFRKTRESATNRAHDIVESVVGFFEKLPGRAATAISGLPRRITDILNEIVAKARDIGGDIMDGIARGIRNGWNSAINAARDAAREVLHGFWDAFDSHSPSRLMMREVGIPIMQGVGVGIERGTPDVKKQINESVSRITSGASTHAESRATANVAPAAAAGGGGGGITIHNLSIPITGTFDMSNAQSARNVALQIHKALLQLQRDYR